MNIFEIKKGHFKVYDGKTAYLYHVDEDHNYAKLLNPDVWYWYALRIGLSESETIDLLLRMEHVRRILKVKWLRQLPLCVALIGPRGSGKSVGAAQIVVIDGLLAGRRVVSNMPIQIKVRYRDIEKVFETEDLDAVMMLDVNEFNENYQDCMIVVDETNVYLADAQRSTSNQALFFSYILQQMRKRKLDFIFTTQSEAFQTSRVRFQTDLYIKCRDLAMVPKMGEAFINPDPDELGHKSEWTLYDMSGVIVGDILQGHDYRTNQIDWYAKKLVWNTPFWGCYSSELLQRREKIKLNNASQSTNYTYDEDYVAELARRYNAPAQMLQRLAGQNIKRMQKAELWQSLGIGDDHSMKVKIGRILKQLGCESLNRGKGNEYILPTQERMLAKLTELGLTS